MLFFDEVLERAVILTEFCRHGFVFRELLLKLFDPFELRRLEIAVFRAPFIESDTANPVRLE